MQDTPKSNRLHIAIFGKRNSGKSSLINAITNQDIALVSDVAGTTTDPVYKSMELLPLGPVVIIDTAGLDDSGSLGELRIKKAEEVMDKTDLALLVFDASEKNISLEKEWLAQLKERKIPIIGVINKVDLIDTATYSLTNELNIPLVNVSAKNKTNIYELKEAINSYAPIDFERTTIVGDIITPKATIVLVAPQDIQAPKGRLILPQVQVIRDILDHNAIALTVKDNELESVLSVLNKKPDLVITDSQVFTKVNAIVPEEIPLTSFSILMARYKGELDVFIKGAHSIDNLKPGDKVLIAEACTHHPLEGDIARTKLPDWLKKYTNVNLNISIKAGIDFSDDLSEYKLIIHCGACMFNRKQMMTRILKAESLNVPITNFGIAIAHMNGILKRVTEVFYD